LPVGCGELYTLAATLCPGGARRWDGRPPAPVRITDGMVQRGDVEAVFGEIEDSAGALLVVVPTTGRDDGGAEVEASF
jgi:hypothetical protein